MNPMRETESQHKQEIKSQRVRAYFVQAAKQIILDEGVENISVRKVADLAGYSFTTIYNYFTDINALLQEVKTEMIRDAMMHTQSQMPDKTYDLDDIKQSNRTYAAYYFERPHVFRFFYSYRLTPVTTAPAELPDFEKLWQETYRGFVQSGVIRQADVPIVSKTIIYALHGLLALYFSDNGMTKETFFADLDAVTDYLLGGQH